MTNDDEAFINNDMCERVDRVMRSDPFKIDLWDNLFKSDINDRNKAHFSELYRLTKRCSPTDKAVMLAAIIDQEPILALKFIAEKLKGDAQSEDGKSV